MVFKGTLGVGGTIQTLPTASASNEGYTYKVITAGTYAGTTAKVGDIFTSDGSTWVLIPSGDEDTDTWRAIKVNGVEKLGNGISSGSLDVVDTDNIEAEFDANGNKLKLKTRNIYTQSEVDAIVDSILPTDSVSKSAIANFETDYAKPIEFKAYIEAVQASGTPTPSAPLPISGVSSVKVFQRGANLWDKSTIINGYYINDTNGAQKSNTGDACTDYIEIKPDTSYYIYTEQTTGRWGAWYDKDKNFISGINLYGVKTSPSNARYIRLTVVRNGNGNPNTFSINYPSSDTEYHAYNGEQITIALGDTYYGGYVEVDKDGHRRLVVTKGYIASYDGETIGEPWISSMDAYVSGTTPTSGAQVVYTLSTPTIIPLPDGEPITALNGVNNVFCDSGDTEVTYKLSINKALSNLGGGNRSVNLAKSVEEEVEDEPKDEPETRQER